MPRTTKSTNVMHLNNIQNQLHIKCLKELGFKKSGRTFNKRCDSGIVQVINFQSGQYPISNTSDSLYGYFTVNIGIYIPDIVEIENIFPIKKGVIQEYDCQIRTRLTNLCYSEDRWWAISDECEGLLDEIINCVNSKGIEFFKSFESQMNVIFNLDQYIDKYKIMTRNHLDKALIYYKIGEINKSKKEFHMHLEEKQNKNHIEYVNELIKKLELDI